MATNYSALGASAHKPGLAAINASLPTGSVTLSMRGPDYEARFPNGTSLLANKEGVFAIGGNGQKQPLDKIRSQGALNIFQDAFAAGKGESINGHAAALYANAERALSSPQSPAPAAPTPPATMMAKRPSASAQITV